MLCVDKLTLKFVLQGGVDPKDAKQFFLVLTNWLWNGVTSRSEFSSMQRICSVYIALPKSFDLLKSQIGSRSSPT
jgi:hypothetical protein